MCTSSASGLGDATTHFDGRIRITVAFSQPIALPENMSYWYLLKKLANYRPGENDNERPRSRWSGLVARGGDGYDKGEVEGDIGRSCTEVETRFQYNPNLGGAAGEKEFHLENNWPELLSEAFAEAAEKICDPGHGVELRFEHGGADGDAKGGAVESMLTFLRKRALAQERVMWTFAAVESMCPGGCSAPRCRGSTREPRLRSSTPC